MTYRRVKVIDVKFFADSRKEAFDTISKCFNEIPENYDEFNIRVAGFCKSPRYLADSTQVPSRELDPQSAGVRKCFDCKWLSVLNRLFRLFGKTDKHRTRDILH